MTHIECGVGEGCKERTQGGGGGGSRYSEWNLQEMIISHVLSKL